MRARPLAPLTALLLTAALSLPVAAQAQDPPPTAPGTDAAAATPSVAAPRVVTLVTGDRVRLSTAPNGEPSATVLPDSGTARDAFLTLQAGGHLYVVPQSAAPYLNQPLDPSLFDVTDLARRGYGVGANPLRVTIDAAPGAAARTVTGLGASGTTANVGRAGAADFGRALRAQWAHDRAAGAAGGAMFSGVRRIAADGAAPAGTAGADSTAAIAADSPLSTPAAAPDPAALHTLKVKGFDRRGNKTFGDTVVAFNVDDSDLYIAGQSFFRGEAAFSVPAGHYELASFIGTGYPDHTGDFSLVAAPEVEVTGPTVVVLDARKATRISAQTPDPTSQVYASVELGRFPVHGLGFSTGLTTLGPTALYATPTAPVTVGRMGFVASMRLGDENGDTSAYLYDLLFANDGSVPADLTRTVTRDQLATVHARYPSLVPNRQQVTVRQALLPWGQVADATADLVTAPSERAEYLLGPAGTLWFGSVDSDLTGGGVTMVDRVRTLGAGDELTETWFGSALHPGAQQEDLPVGQRCPACRQGDMLALFLPQWTDGTPGHWSLDSGVPASLDVYQNGALSAHLDAAQGAVKLSPDPADYRLVLDVNRQGQWWQTSTATHTEWSYSSRARGADAGDVTPSDWDCATKGGGGRGLTSDVVPNGGKGGDGGGDGGGSTGPCNAEPLLLLDYALPTDLADTLPAESATTLDVTVRHQKYAVDSPVTTVTAEVSFDDGTSWTPAEVTPSGADGTYRAAFTTPATGTGSGYVSLRVHAVDADGNRVDQTVTRAAALPWAQLTDGGGGPTPPPPPGRGAGVVPACAEPAAPTEARCFALVNTAADSGGRAGLAADEPRGYGPADLRDAYDLPESGGEDQTIAIIDAFDNPNAEADLAAYRAHYGLPACTTANGCFRKVNQRGDATALPPAESGWGLEISLDLDMASAVCPNCRLILVEADTPSLFDLAEGVRTAVRMGATQVSNSYGSRGELSYEEYFERMYKYRGVAVVASSGDYGYGNGLALFGGPGYPGVSEFVTSVGGTSLTRADNERGWTESAWAGSTSGCSAYIHKPGWQKDGLCSMRTVADVSAVGDPETGVAVYDTFGFDGWVVVGGTSASAPIIAGVYALAGNSAAVRYGSEPYRHPGALYDVVGGANGTNCFGSYLCTGLPGYDGPTGLGTPRGTGAF